MKNSSRYLSFLIVLLLFAGLLTPVSAAAADNARVEVILVRAGNGEAGVDAALRPYASTLQRLFRFQRYEMVSRKSMRLSLPGDGSVSLSGGQELTVSAASSGSGIKADIDWTRGSKRLLHTRIQLRPGSPAVLGGPRSESGTWLLILQLK
jgi:hypothetical protein